MKKLNLGSASSRSGFGSSDEDSDSEEHHHNPKNIKDFVGNLDKVGGLVTLGKQL